MNEILLKNVSLRDKVYLENGSGFVCLDKKDSANKSVEIVPTHINPNLDNPADFPQFTVIKTTSKDGSIGTHKRTALILDTDNEPTEGSYKLLTSGLLYEIINDLQNQINELKNLKPNK